MSISKEDFEEDEFEGLFALVQFLRHDVMRADLAYAWLGQGMLQISRDKLEPGALGEDSWGVVCIRFTTVGRKLAKKLMKLFVANPDEFQALEDPFLDEKAGPRDTFLMHDRRFRSEIESWDFKTLLDRYHTTLEFDEAAEIW